ncbi:C4-dicarboxylic acid transporter DauA [Pseudomonas sp. Fig-3]|jgi:SulP family sulfate permease|uniref:C4-dicarboxylic acid transporter DauA n=1 Tax=Pseudomonas TaxID=286 RepID=UPI0006403FC6|nr:MULTISPECIES: C4-dicarboxylic acid transporter DauA [Pseudomonas]MDD2034736.1 C4-dicarboxylic acid transporter DauA [Pseudomonas sp. 39167]MEA1030331.1 C4-dicarboxylic acid transporter DauA [Pseudomonas sp. N-137]MXR31953.1 C4-dicarboxylic acid transporter DauA [Pseudomonas sp. PICF6]QKJ37721.1 C4-dicarboxylic acid transporter DauA [Pseudomonas sp. MPDS]TNB77558.1 C4-dicarboxylic acid transporter DauA [Pseudomonas sp. Fig-3]
MSFSAPPIFAAWRQTWRAGYTLERLRGDLVAGLTVGIIAIPLAMALAIAVGVPPQHGLYTVLVAAPLIALTGGSRFNVSGPTAAFVVILLPITQQYGLGGLLLCTMLAGMILIALGLMRAGRLIQYIPYPVVLGFTAGIGVVIATLQLKDLLGLTTVGNAEHYIEQLGALITALPSARLGDGLIGLICLAVLIVWPRWVPRVPGHLVALLVGALLGLALESGGWQIATLGERFSYVVDGISYPGIPPFLPSFDWPWNLPDNQGRSLELSYDLIRQLLGPAFAIAMLGAIESLLCAVVADGMTGSKHDPNAELIGQGLGNLVAPLFGGITATAAIARSATNVRSGAFSPLAAIIHSLVVLGAIVLLAPLFSYLPMAALAALLVMVAWNMSEAGHVLHTLRIAPRSDVLVLLTCLSLTVLFDMVLAVAVGLLLAAGLFIKRMSELTDTAELPRHFHQALLEMPEHVRCYAIRGPLFFGAAEKALDVLRKFDPGIRVMVVEMSAVPMLDMTALAAFESILKDYRKQGIGLILVATAPRVRLKLRRAGIHREQRQLAYVQTLEQARAKSEKWLAGSAAHSSPA